MKKILSETARPRALIFWYLASPSEPLPSFFSNYIPAEKMTSPGVHMFYIGLYSEKHEKIV